MKLFPFLKGKPIYGNYGRDEDFQELLKNGGSLTGTVLLFRAGEITFADKVGFVSWTPIKRQEYSLPKETRAHPGRRGPGGLIEGLSPMSLLPIGYPPSDSACVAFSSL